MINFLTLPGSGHTIGIMKSHYDAIEDPMDGKEHFAIEIALPEK